MGGRQRGDLAPRMESWPVHRTQDGSKEGREGGREEVGRVRVRVRVRVGRVRVRVTYSNPNPNPNPTYSNPTPNLLY